MTITKELIERSQSKCELCELTESLEQMILDDEHGDGLENSVVLCSKCREEISKSSDFDSNHFRCLNDSMWSEHRPVQIMVYRVLSMLTSESWATDLKSQMYLDDDGVAIAESVLRDSSSGDDVIQLDSNGAQLMGGDNVTLIKDLVVKGANFTAKRGTMVRNISLTDNPEHIEGKVNGTRIVLVTKFLKKVNE